MIEASDRFREISSTDLDARIMTTPALVGGVVFIRTENTLIAYSA